MNRSLILLGFVAAFCVAINAEQVSMDHNPWESIGFQQCHAGLLWSDCNGMCRRTCNNPRPVECLERICRPGCICPDGQVMNRFGECVNPRRCVER